MDEHYDVKIVVPGTAISKKNSMIVARGRLIKDKKVRDYEALVKAFAMQAMQDAGMPVIKHPCAMEISCFYSDRRRRDVQNAPAAICDALNGIIYHDDCQIVHLSLDKWLTERGNERVEIKIWILPENDRYPLTKVNQ